MNLIGNMRKIFLGPILTKRRGRNAGHPAPPTQSRTCGFPASGSSVVLASVQDINNYALIAIPHSEVGLCLPDPTVSGISFFCGLRTSVKSFTMYAAFQRSEYYA